jgi:hypothetical protein
VKHGTVEKTQSLGAEHHSAADMLAIQESHLFVLEQSSAHSHTDVNSCTYCQLKGRVSHPATSPVVVLGASASSGQDSCQRASSDLEPGCDAHAVDVPDGSYRFVDEGTEGMCA